MRFLGTTLALASTCGGAYAQGWYQSVGSHCSGSTALNSAVATFLPKGLPLAAIPPAGNFAVKLTPAELSLYSSSPPYLFAHTPLDDAKAASLRTVFKGQSSEKVPFLAKIANAFLINFSIPNILLNVGAGAAFDYFYQSVDAQPTSIENATGFIANGGKLERKVSVRKSVNGGRFLVDQLSYSVPVGNESRSFIVSACVFPVAMVVSEFQTTGQFNNKIVKPKNGSTWGVFDITDNKWDSMELRLVSQEVDYYVFESDEVEYNNVVGKTTHRMSLVGGPWARKRSDSTNFANLYLNIGAK